MWIFVHNIPLRQSVVQVFESFYRWQRAPFWSAFCFSITAVNDKKNGSCFLPGSDAWSAENLTKRNNWPAFLKCKKRKWLLLINCPPHPPPDLYKHRHKNDHFIISFYLRLLGHDKLSPMCNGWQFWIPVPWTKDEVKVAPGLNNAHTKSHLSCNHQVKMYNRKTK